jgi:hypothetical protein
MTDVLRGRPAKDENPASCALPADLPCADCDTRSSGCKPRRFLRGPRGQAGVSSDSLQHARSDFVGDQSWKANTKSGQPSLRRTRCEPPLSRLMTNLSAAERPERDGPS